MTNNTIDQKTANIIAEYLSNKGISSTTICNYLNTTPIRYASDFADQIVKLQEFDKAIESMMEKQLTPQKNLSGLDYSNDIDKTRDRRLSVYRKLEPIVQSIKAKDAILNNFANLFAERGLTPEKITVILESHEADELLDLSFDISRLQANIDKNYDVTNRVITGDSIRAGVALDEAKKRLDSIIEEKISLYGTERTGK